MHATAGKVRQKLRYLKKPLHIKYWFDEVGLGTKNVFRKNSAKMIIVACSFMLLVIFIIAYFYHNMGLFVVSVDPKLQAEGFIISSTEDFESPRVKLFSDALENCNNISINEIAEDVDEHDGEHNGKNYVAYTFYLKNGGKKKLNYEYSLDIEDSSKNVENAAWVMLIKNGSPAVYAMGRSDGTPERMYNYSGYPYMENSKNNSQVHQLSSDYKGLVTKEDLDNYRYVDSNGLYEIVTVPFENSSCVVSDTRKELDSGEVDKYTVVVWLEGNDMQCIDDIKDGTIGLGMKFTKNDSK